MKTLLLVFGLMLSLPTVGQDIEHAPTVEQCRADQRLWKARLKGGGGPLPSVQILSQWHGEMIACWNVDPTTDQNDYAGTTVYISVEESNRYLAFIKRHNLYKQFEQEDKEGKR
jgi:hypothetical protein